MQALTDNEIVALYKETRNHELVGELFRRYTRFVFLVCMKYLKEEDAAKDATMQVFEELFEKLKKHEIHHFKPWLYMVVKNHCLIHLRQEKKSPPGKRRRSAMLPILWNFPLSCISPTTKKKP